MWFSVNFTNRQWSEASLISNKRWTIKRNQKKDDNALSSQDELFLLRRRRDLQVTGKPKPPQNRNTSLLKQILSKAGFKIRGDRLTIKRDEAIFEIDLKMGGIYVLREGAEPLSLCVTVESHPWTNIEGLSDFDLFLLSVIYLLTNEELPQSILQQIHQKK